jgi:ribonucleoside-diphosphate reductase alpha chain
MQASKYDSNHKEQQGLYMSLPTAYQQIIHQSRYARYRDDLKRRETWAETVERYISYFKEKNKKRAIPWDELKDAILKLEVMPSMRSMMTAGEALDKDQVAGYNCSYLPIDNPKAFDEIMYLSMCGVGVGFSVESKYTNKLPEIPDELHETDTTIIFKDSKLGWASGYREFLSLLWSGKIAKWDVSKLRPAGARLRTFGGRSSGPEPLIDLMKFTIGIFEKARGRKLSTIECHDIACKIADIVVSGGVRRSAMISLSDLNDDKIRHAKSGNWYNTDGHRALSNNSAVYEVKPDMETFLNEFMALYASKSGERGIFSRVASKAQVAKNGRRDPAHDWGTNPCSEIILRPYQFCNLSEVIVRAGDKLTDLQRKVRLATILGTLQSAISDFRYINKKWKNNTEEERLLGVSLTGIMDHKTLSDATNKSLPTWLNTLRETAVETNKQYAEILKIEPSKAITCVKPSGTVSQLTDTASGIHPRYAQYYIRRIRMAKTDPMAQFMIQNGFEVEEDFYAKNNWVFSFPTKAPDDCVSRNDMTAVEQLEHWKVFQEHYCEHKPSITVYVGDDEWLEVGAWVFKNIQVLSGVAFLPRDNGKYRQAPYEEIDETTYKKMMQKRPPNIEWTKFNEETDTTIASQQLACSSGVCEI